MDQGRSSFNAEPYSLAFDRQSTALIIIERENKTAAIFALAAAILSYFGFIHSSGVGVGDGFGMAPSITVAYLVVAAILYWTDSMAKAEIGAGSSEAAAGD